MASSFLLILGATKSTSTTISKPSLSSDTVTDDYIMNEETRGQFFGLQCRSIRVGSYKSMPKEKSFFTQKGIHLRVPDIWEGKKMK